MPPARAFFNDSTVIPPLPFTGSFRWSIERHDRGLAASPRWFKIVKGTTQIPCVAAPSAADKPLPARQNSQRVGSNIVGRAAASRGSSPRSRSGACHKSPSRFVCRTQGSLRVPAGHRPS